MSKYGKVILIALGVVICLYAVVVTAGEVHAYDLPVQSGNVTDVILWYGDNVTANVTAIVTANLTGGLELGGNLTLAIPSLSEDLESAAIAHAEEIMDRVETLIAQYFQTIFIAVVILVMHYFAYRYREKWLCMIAGFAMILWAFPLWSTYPDYWYMSILLVLVGMYDMAKVKYDKKGWVRE